MLGNVVTDGDGRAANLLPAGMNLERGTYRLRFDVARYFQQRGVEAFYPEVNIMFEVRSPQEHYHVPLLLSPYGYTTYRGS